MRFFLLIIVLVFSMVQAEQSFAQGSATGCYLSSTNIVYTYEPFANTYFSSKSGLVGLSANYCSWTQTVVNPTSCIVCTGPNSIVYNTSTFTYISCDGPVVGLRGTFMMVACSLDDYTWILVSVLSVIGFFFLRKKIQRNLAVAPH